MAQNYAAFALVAVAVQELLGGRQVQQLLERHPDPRLHLKVRLADPLLVIVGYILPLRSGHAVMMRRHACGRKRKTFF